MTAPLQISLVFGTRPEAIKLAPVITALAADPAFRPRVIVTGQHREMLDATLGGFGIVPDVDLGVMQPGQTLNELVARMMPRLDQLYAEERPDMVVVQGDTTSAFCAALAAFHRRLPVAHVEAGLRSYDRFHPYPEETNRRMIAACADLHFPPTAHAAAALRAEGVSEASVTITGNTAVDALLLALGKADVTAPRRGRTVLMTMHRREAWAAPGASGASVLEEILLGIRNSALAHPDVSFVYPVHLNPQVRAPVRKVLGELANVSLIEPLPYIPFVHLMSQAEVIVSDSGGIQEEGPSLGVPVLVLRKTTERPEALAGGTNQLVGTDTVEIEAALAKALATPRRPPASLPCPNPYGDGRAAPRIRDALLSYFGRGPAPVPFGATS